MILEKWRAGEIFFTSAEKYDDPFMEVDLTVTFTHESGEKLIRPAFWLGQDSWCVRFAPTLLGTWNYETACSNRKDSGLNGITGEISCIEYTGDLEIYKRGFVKVSENNRYFTYADGTPFYYLGDTHWLMFREPFDSSNAEGIESCFKFMVDYRLTQGFTVYQSEPIGLSFKNGMDEGALKNLNDNFDKKFKYIADKGLLHTNAQLFFSREIQEKEYTPELLVKLSKMWSARYGAYPVLWTIAQEVDPDFYNHADMAKWPIVGETLYNWDCYKHPLTGHMCNENRCFANNTKWGDKYYHSWFGMQPQGMQRKAFKEFYDYKITKPIVNYETGYEHLWSNEDSSYFAGYRSFLNGACGYGYGAHGVWNGNISSSVWMNYGGYMRWLEGMLQLGAKRLPILTSLLKAINWYEIVPHFEDKEYWNAPHETVYATLGNHTHFVFDHSHTGISSTLYKVENGTYSLLEMEVNTGIITERDTITVTDGTANIPPRSVKKASLFILTTKPETYKTLPLNISSTDLSTLLTFKGDSLTLVANKPCSWSVDDETIATVSSDGILTATGKNGLVNVTAVCGNEKATRKFMCIGQDKCTPAQKPEKIEILCEDVVSAPKASVVAVPKFTPENCFDQTVSLDILDENGNTSYLMINGKNFELSPVGDGEVYIVMTSPSGVKSEPKKVTLTGYGKLSLTIGGEATSSDYHEFYDVRGLPSKAINGSIARFSGWASGDVCSEEKPVSLTVTLAKASDVNNVKIYLTDQGYTLKSFDIVLEGNGKKTTIASIRNNTQIVLEFDFDRVFTEKIHVVCFDGDGNGNARVDQLNAFLKE